MGNNMMQVLKITTAERVANYNSKFNHLGESQEHRGRNSTGASLEEYYQNHLDKETLKSIYRMELNNAKECQPNFYKEG